MSLLFLKKEVEGEVDFLHVDKHIRVYKFISTSLQVLFLQVYFNTLGIKVSLEVILLLLMGMIKVLKVTSLQNLYSISKKS